MEPPLRRAEIPDWQDGLLPILEFALTFNGYERLTPDLGRLKPIVAPVITSLENSGEAPAWAGVDLLRAALFFLQRQTHHWGDVPHEQEQQMRTHVRSIGERAGNLALVADASV